MYDFLASTSCLVDQLSLFLDGASLQCSQLAPEVRCTSCAPAEPVMAVDLDFDEDMLERLAKQAENPERHQPARTTQSHYGSGTTVSARPTEINAMATAQATSNAISPRNGPDQEPSSSNPVLSMPTRHTYSSNGLQYEARQRKVLEAVTALIGNCSFCYTLGRAFIHSDRTCQSLQQFNFQQFLGKVTLAPYSGCYTCFLPQYLCQPRARLPDCSTFHQHAIVKGILLALVIQSDETVRLCERLGGQTMPSALPQDFAREVVHSWCKKVKISGVECYQVWPVIEHLLLVSPPSSAGR